MTAPAWMPFYVADYLADTGHLSTLEHGAYLLLIAHYWQNGGLPTEAAKLARICRLPLKQWHEIEPTIADLFVAGWKHKRIEAELANALQTMSKRSAAGRAAAVARHANRTANAQQAHTDRNANAPPNAVQTHLGEGEGPFQEEELSTSEVGTGGVRVLAGGRR